MKKLTVLGTAATFVLAASLAFADDATPGSNAISASDTSTQTTQQPASDNSTKATQPAAPKPVKLAVRNDHSATMTGKKPRLKHKRKHRRH